METGAAIDREHEFRAAARSARLRYVSDTERGFARRRRGKSFTYVRPSGEALRDPAALARIRSLAIPPAWKEVWICRTPNGHLQATGRDARGRAQYRYHPRWREAQDQQKYERAIAFAKALPKIRRTVARHLRKRGLFQYLDEGGAVRDVGSGDVNEYLRSISGEDFTAKGFRTWGTALAAQALQEFQEFDSAAAAKRNITKAIERVAERLGNTQAICRKCYVHPAIIEAYMDRSLVRTLKRKTETELRGRMRLSSEEAAVLALLQQRMEHELGGRRRRYKKGASSKRRKVRRHKA